MGKKKAGAVKTAGIRELRAKLSQYVRAVEEGDTVQVTDRGRVVACLVPPEVAELGHLTPVDRVRHQLLAEGFFSRLGTQDKGPLPPVPKLGASKEAVDAALDWTREDKV